MPMQFKMLAPAAAKEKIMSFYEEALLITGMSVGV